MDLKFFMKKFFLISKYCPILNSNVNTVVTDMNNIELSIDSDSSKEGYYINSNSSRNNIVTNSNNIDNKNKNIKISNSENNSIVSNNIVNRSFSEYRVYINECVNIYVTWY